MLRRVDYDEEREPDSYDDDPCETCGGRVAWYGMGDGTRLDPETYVYVCEGCGDTDRC